MHQAHGRRGYGYLSGQYGMVVDNPVGTRMVIADGSILNVLFFGIRLYDAILRRLCGNLTILGPLRTKLPAISTA